MQPLWNDLLMLCYLLTTCGHTNLHFSCFFHSFFKSPQILRIGLDGCLHMVLTFRGEVSSALAAWEVYSATDVWIVLRRGQDPTWAEASLTTESVFPAKTPRHRCSHGCPQFGIAFHTDADAVVNQMLSLCRHSIISPSAA